MSLCAEREPDVVLMDLEMPVLDGIEATRRIRAAQPGVAVVLTSFSDRERILRALDAGAAGYLLKDAEPAELRRAIEAAARGEAPSTRRRPGRFSAPVARRAPRTRCRSGSGRFSMVGEGPEQGDRAPLGISEKTVAHLTSVYRQIGVTDRTQAALWAERHGVTRDASWTEVRLRALRDGHDRPMTLKRSGRLAAIALAALAALVLPHRTCRRRAARGRAARGNLYALERCRAPPPRGRRRDQGRARDRDAAPRREVERDPAARAADRLPRHRPHPRRRHARARRTVPDWFGRDTIVARASGPRGESAACRRPCSPSGSLTSGQPRRRAVDADELRVGDVAVAREEPRPAGLEGISPPARATAAPSWFARTIRWPVTTYRNVPYGTSNVTRSPGFSLSMSENGAP